MNSFQFLGFPNELLISKSLVYKNFSNELIRMSQNRRKFHRMSAIDPNCVLAIAGQKFEAVSINESIGGIGVQFSDPFPIKFGTPVTLTTESEVIKGRCRSLIRTDGIDFLMGIQRISEKSVDALDNQRGWLLRSFIQAQGQWLHCKIIEQQNSSEMKIQLVDGTQFVTTSNKICLMTPDERAKMLKSDEQFKQASKTYKLLAPHLNLRSHEHLLQLEFQDWPSMVPAA